MAGLIATIWAFMSDWHRLEFRRIGNFGVALVASPLAFIVIGGLLGAANWQLKAWVVGIGILLAFMLFLWLAWRRLAIGVEIAAALAVTEQGAVTARGAERRFLGDVRVAAENYVRLVAAILASEITIGLIVIVLPEHVSPVLTLLLILASLSLTMWAVWRKTAVNAWATTVQWVAIGTIIVAIAGIVGSILLPQAMQVVGQHGVGADGSVAAVIRGTPTAVQLFWVIAGLVILAVVVPAALKGNAAGAIGWGAALLAIALFFGYYVRDEEERERRAQAAQAARPPRAEAAPSPTPPRAKPPSQEPPVQPRKKPEQPAIDPTIVRRGDGLAHVGITGANQCVRTPAPVHCTGIMVPPGGEAAVRHLRGAFVLDRKNEPVPLCGDRKASRRGLAFPLIPRYAMAVSLATPDYDYEPREWRCGEEEIRLANNGTKPLEIVLFFNDHGRRGRDPSRRDRVWFAVELKHRAGWKNPAIAPVM